MQYNNPIIRGVNPDPSICRVGEDFYLVTSSFEYFPGIPVYHSRDLVNWKQIGNCIARPQMLPMEKAKSSGGVWAPTIRYEDGIFYVTATFDGIGNFIIKSTDPAGGWSDPIWIHFDGIDPSITFVDGEMYYCANDFGMRREKEGDEGISLTRLDKDTGEIIGEVKQIWKGTGEGWLEAPHIYQLDHYYYIVTAEGGTESRHMVTVGRSRSIWGPYEPCPQNPILTNRNDTSLQVACSGHADLFEDGRGNWWMVHLGTRPVQGMSSIGRETFLMPVTWQNGWPVVGTDKKTHLKMEGPLWNRQAVCEKKRYDFGTEAMEPQWLFRRSPDLACYERKNSMLLLTASVEKMRDAWGTTTFVALRQPDSVFEIEADLEFYSCNDGDMLGMAVYLSENYYCRIGKKRYMGEEFLVVEQKMEGLEIELYRGRINKKYLKLRITSDGSRYYFAYEEQGSWKCVGQTLTKFLSCELAGKCFTGTLIGMFAECDIPEAYLCVREVGVGIDCVSGWCVE